MTLPHRLPVTRAGKAPLAGRLALLLAAGCILGAGAGGAPARAQQAAPEAASPPPPASVPLREEQFQAWTVVCGTPSEGAPEQCEMRQRITDAEGNPRLMAVVGTVPNRAEPAMVLLMPLGIYLPAGVSLQIDDGPALPLEVQVCTPGACQAELLLEGELVARLKAGTKAIVTYAGRNPQGQVGRAQADLSLLGFTAALDRIQG